MVEGIALLVVCLAGALGIACFIHYFWQIGFIKAFGYAGFFVLMFLLFWASGMWVNASRHSWGVLTPVFMGIIVGCWAGIKFGPGWIKILREKIEERKRR